MIKNTIYYTNTIGLHYISSKKRIVFNLHITIQVNTGIEVIKRFIMKMPCRRNALLITGHLWDANGQQCPPSQKNINVILYVLFATSLNKQLKNVWLSVIWDTLTLECVFLK